MDIPLRGGYVQDAPQHNLRYWIPPYPLFSSAALVTTRGYQPLDESDTPQDALLLVLLSTFASVVCVHHTGQPAPRYYAYPEDIAFARRVPLALAETAEAEEQGQALKEDGRFLPVDPMSLRHLGEIGVVQFAGSSPTSNRSVIQVSLIPAQEAVHRRFIELAESLAPLSIVSQEWLARRAELHRQAQELAESYWRVTQIETESRPKTLAPVAVFDQDGVAKGPTPMALWSVIAALIDACEGTFGWEAEGFKYTYTKGETLVSLEPGATPQQFQALDVDVALLVILLYTALPRQPDNTVGMTLEMLMLARGRQPVKRRDRLEPSWHPADLKDVRASLERLSQLHLKGKVTVRGVPLEFAPARFLEIEPPEWGGGAGIGQHRRAWWVKPGSWFDIFQPGKAGNQRGVYLQHLFRQDLKQSWRKRVGYHLMFSLRIAAGKGQSSIRRSVGELEQACALRFNPGRQEEARRRFEETMDWLETIGLVGACDYERPAGLTHGRWMAPPNSLRQKQWLDQWRQFMTLLPIGPALLNHGYQDLLDRAAPFSKGGWKHHMDES